MIQDGRYTVDVVAGAARSGPTALKTVLGAFSVRELERVAKQLRRTERTRRLWASNHILAAMRGDAPPAHSKRLAAIHETVADAMRDEALIIERRIVRLRNGTTKNRKPGAPR